MNTIVTKHAQQRLWQRLQLNKAAIQRVSDKVFECGIHHCETSGSLNKWVTSHYFNNPAANNIRLYGEFAWVFADNKLITVIPIPNRLKNSVRGCMKRRSASKQV